MGFGAFSVIFTVMFIVVFGMIVITIVLNTVRGVGTWNRNNNSPRLTVPAVVVAKRTEVSRHTHANAGDISGSHGHHTTLATTYYVTFQFDSGDRQEFSVHGSEYGLLVEGDEGDLLFQGTRYLAFDRKV